MNRKTFFGIIALTFSVFVLHAQEIPFKIQKSEVFKDEYKYSTILDVADDGAGGVFIARSYRGGGFSSAYGYYFEHYDANLKLLNELDYEHTYPQNIKQGSILGVITNENQVSLIDFCYNNDENAYICSAYTANINDFKFKGKELFRIKREMIKSFSFFSSSQFDGDSGASMIINDEKTAFVITVDIKDKDTETHQVFLFDSALNKKFDNVFSRDIQDKYFKYEGIEVSNDGNTLYLLGKVYTEEKRRKKEGGKYQFEIAQITAKTTKALSFDTEENYCNSLKLIVLENKLVCVGFYSERNDNRFKGICCFQVNPDTFTLVKSKYNPFPEQFIIDKYGKHKDKELKNLSFRNLFITPNKDIIFNAEEYYITVQTSGGGMYGMTSTRSIYHYDDIVSAKINKEGDLVWARNINKRQSTSGDESYISYTSAIKNDQTFFFINTGEKVKKLSNDRIQFGQTGTNKSNLNLIRILPDGNFDFQEILDDKDNEVPFMVSDGVFHDKSVIFLGRKGKKKQLLKISL